MSILLIYFWWRVSSYKSVPNKGSSRSGNGLQLNTYQVREVCMCVHFAMFIVCLLMLRTIYARGGKAISDTETCRDAKTVTSYARRYEWNYLAKELIYI